MKIRITAALTCLLMCGARLGAASYYVDSAAGNDSNSGTSIGTPWKTLTKVNGKVFQPGDSLLFKAGGSWVGQLNPKGSGSAGMPIIVDLYGEGQKPIINGNGVTGMGAVYLYNQEYWEINNLEIINDAPTGGDRRGVYLAGENYGTLRHLWVRNCHIHNIKGIVDQISSSAKRTGGIIVETVSDKTVPTRFDDVLIENCVISTVDNQGIALNNKISVGDYPGTPAWEARKFTRVVIRGNSINDVAKNAIIVRLTDETGLIEHNVCWDTAFRALTGNTIFSRSCRGTVFQYNEGYLNRTTAFDGSLYDADLQSPGCIFQYSYSHDNNHGLYWQCTDAADTNVIVRYNISQNDKGIIFCMNFDAQSTYVYNNTVYAPAHLSPRIIDERRSGVKTYAFYNNIFYNLSPTASYQWFNGLRTFDYNVFYGYHPAGEPADPHKLTSDPMLKAPGTGATGLNSVAGYQLQPGSPCIDSGKLIPNNGGKDYWGNPVPDGTLPDRGAYEFPASLRRPPTVITHPQSQTVLPGADTILSVVADGAPPLAYQWRKTYVPLPNARTNSLSLTHVSAADAAGYDVVVTNAFGSITSDVAVLTIEAPEMPTNALMPSSRATVRDGSDVNVNIDEQSLGYLMVKYNTAGRSAKTYLEFDFTGNNPDPAKPAVLALARNSISGPQHLRLWALNQPYPGMNESMTWNSAQANETGGNSMLTAGTFTASALLDVVEPSSGPGTTFFNIPPPWGQYIKNNRLVLALTGVDDPVNTTTGYRIAIADLAQMPSFRFSAILGSAPAAQTLSVSAVTINGAQLNANVNPGNVNTTCWFEYGQSTDYGSLSAPTILNGTNEVIVSSSVAGLTPSRAYHCRIVATNSLGSATGQDVTFTTLTLPQPSLQEPEIAENGLFQFVFDNPYDVEFTVLAANDPGSPITLWANLGTPVPVGDGLYRFVDSASSNHSRRFYLLRTP